LPLNVPAIGGATTKMAKVAEDIPQGAPASLEYRRFAVPGATAVTTPVVAFTVKIAGLELDHNPPETEDEYTELPPAQSDELPVITPGKIGCET